MLYKISSAVSNGFLLTKGSKHIYIALGNSLPDVDVRGFTLQVSRIHLPVNDSFLTSLSSFAYIESGKKIKLYKF